MGRSFGIFLDSRILKGSTVGSKSEGRHEGGTRDPRRDHVRIPKEIVLIRESAVAEFLADHERATEKNRACKGCSKGAQRGSFLGSQSGRFSGRGGRVGSPRGRRRRVVVALATSDTGKALQLLEHLLALLWRRVKENCNRRNAS